MLEVVNIYVCICTILHNLLDYVYSNMKCFYSNVQYFVMFIGNEKMKYCELSDSHLNILYCLRILKCRDSYSRIFSILNFFQSVERKLNIGLKCGDTLLEGYELNELGIIQVVNNIGRKVVHQYAFTELYNVLNQLICIGTHYIQQWLLSELHTCNGSGKVDTSSIDRLAILKDLLDCEYEYQR